MTYIVTIFGWQFSIAILIGSIPLASANKGSAPRFNNKHTDLKLEIVLKMFESEVKSLISN